MADPVFPISGVNTPDDDSRSDPFDLDYVYEIEPNTDITPVQSDIFVPNSNQEGHLAEVCRLQDLVASFATGFDARSFPDYIQGWIPRLPGYLFPGSYAHLLVILLEDWDLMEYFQLHLFQWLCERHTLPPRYRVDGSSGTDGNLFASELRVLRKLLAPLRGDDSRPIYWIGSRITNPDDSCAQMTTMMRIIKNFKEELFADVQGTNDDRTIYGTEDPNFDHKAEISVREFRMSACRGTLGWGEFLKTNLHFTSFYQYYRACLVENTPDHARAIGFLPPLQPAIPPYTPLHPDAETVAWCSWSQPEYQNSILDLVLKIAVWLGLARGAAAVHLFCDIVRAFSLKPPSVTTDSDRIALLYHFTSLRISCDGVESGLATPFSHDDDEDEDRELLESDYPGLVADSDNEVGLTYYMGVDPVRQLNAIEVDAFFENPNGGGDDVELLPWEQLPLLSRRLKVTRGQGKLYYDREIVASLYHSSVELTLSSKLVPAKPKPENSENEDAHGEKPSQPIPIPERRGSPTPLIG